MAKFTIRIEETCVRAAYISIEADTQEEAKSVVTDGWCNGHYDYDLEVTEYVDYDTIIDIADNYVEEE